MVQDPRAVVYSGIVGVRMAASGWGRGWGYGGGLRDGGVKREWLAAAVVRAVVVGDARGDVKGNVGRRVVLGGGGAGIW